MFSICDRVAYLKDNCQVYRVYLKNHRLYSSYKIYLKLWSFPLALVLIAQTEAIGSAQIVPDRTLPENSVVTPDGDIIEITGGTTKDKNLFHSFEQFSVLKGQTAFFNNAATIDNIIGRVTGDSASQIEGLIRANGTANLFLLNPNGIRFGNDASLDLGGSFVGSAANSLKFADGSEFSATTPDAPLLTVSIPVGLQLGSSSGSIAVEGSGNNLRLNPDFSINRSNRPDGLKVADGKTLALVGQDLDISGGNITAAAGNIELWAVNSGLLSIANDSEQLQIEAGQESLTYGNIELDRVASVDASGNSGGEIQLQAQNISVKEGSVILTDTLGNGSGGNLNIKGVESVKVEGIFAPNPIYSGIVADVAPGASGDGGNLSIEADSLQITDGGQISSGTFGTSDAGSLTVQTQDIQISGGSFLGPSGLFTPVAFEARGNGGDLTIKTSSLKITDAGQISSGTFGFGDGGNLSIEADEIYVSGGNEFAPSSIDTTVYKDFRMPEDIATIFGAGTGEGGDLEITAGSLRVTNGGQILVGTNGTGHSGNLTVEAENVELSSANDLGLSGLFANNIVESGDGGDIDLKSDRLAILDGATISVGNFPSNSNNPDIAPGTGKPGNITINTNSLQLDSTNPEALSSITASTNSQTGGHIILNNVNANISLTGGSQITSETRGDGDGGSIAINANKFNLSDRSEVSVSSMGEGKAGNINFTVTNLDVNEGKITANSRNSGGGNISFNTDFINLQNNSEISTSVFNGDGGGGDITINSNYVIARDNSNILANAFEGDGGNINLTTKVILLSLDSKVDASSKYGLDGVVEINNPDTETQIGLVQLPTKIVDPTALITAVCPLEAENALVTTGKGGLTENPSQNLRGESVWEDLRDFAVTPTDRARKSPFRQTEIVEAKTWNVNAKGKVELLSHVPQQHQQNNSGYWTLFNQCSGM